MALANSTTVSTRLELCWLFASRQIAACYRARFALFTSVMVHLVIACDTLLQYLLEFRIVSNYSRIFGIVGAHCQSNSEVAADWLAITTTFSYLPLAVASPLPPTLKGLVYPFPVSVGQLRRRIRRLVAHIIATHRFVAELLLAFVATFRLAKLPDECLGASTEWGDLGDHFSN